MKTVSVMSTLLAMAVWAAPASAQYQWFENFEEYIGPNAVSPWSLWTERGANHSNTINENEEPDLGDIAGFSGVNRNMAYVGGEGFNGGIYQVINLPLGAGTYNLDAYWRSDIPGNNNSWAEVIVVEGNNPPVNGSDLQNPLHYKDDNFSGTTSWDGLISATSDQVGGALGGSFTTASGTITLVLKAGNSDIVSGTFFDDIHITPEPASAALVGLGALPLLLRRRRSA